MVIRPTTVTTSSMNPNPYPDIPSDTMKRITSAADQLFEEGGRQAFPNVDAVRRKARVNMNDASSVMRVWRRTQTAAAAPLTTAIPIAVQDASQSLVVNLWKAATTAANASLEAAQAGWELERREAETSREQLATALDCQTEELTEAHRLIEKLEHDLSRHSGELNAAKVDKNLIQQKLFAAEASATTSAARAEEIAKRADILKIELEKVHTSAALDREDWKHRFDAAALTVEGMTNALREQSANYAKAREDLARMQGQKDAGESQHHVPGDATEPNGQARGPLNQKLASNPMPKGST